MPVRVLSLFSGIGAHDLGFQWAGMTIVGQCELDEFCNLILEKHWPGLPRWKDVKHVRGVDVRERCGDIDLVTGSFPCQQISVAGKGEGIGTEDVPTDRSGLVWELLRVIREVRPRRLALENVPALRTRGCDAVLDALEKEGYSCWPTVVGAEHLGAPHRRHRVWIVGRLADAICRTIGSGRTVAFGESQGRIAGRDTGAVLAVAGIAGLAGRRGMPIGSGEEVAMPSDGGGDKSVADTGSLQSTGRRIAGVAGTTGEVEGDGEERERLRDATGDGGSDGAVADAKGQREREPADQSNPIAVERRTWNESGDGGELDVAAGARRTWDAGCEASRSVRNQARLEEPSGPCGGSGPAFLWPSRPGQAQYDWEEPRLTRKFEFPLGSATARLAVELVGVIADTIGRPVEEVEAWWTRNRFRVERLHTKHALKAVGNCNPPQTAWAIGKAIMEMDNSK